MDQNICALNLRGELYHSQNPIPRPNHLQTNGLQLNDELRKTTIILPLYTQNRIDVDLST
jgi:hypothetical protein